MRRLSCSPPTARARPVKLVRVLVLDMLENSFRNYRVGYAAAEAVVLLVIVLALTGVQFRFFRDRSRTT
jgi:multiple sugar transport system permease protein